MGYKTIYRQVICCYAKHCRSMVKKQSANYLPVSFHRGIFAGGNPRSSGRILPCSLPLFLISVFRGGGNVLVTLLCPELA